jgi:RNA polymerase sigma factor (sigma-70 family)
MNPDSANPGAAKNDPGPDTAGPSAGNSARLLATFQPLVDRLFAEAAPCPWSLSRERFEAALERSTAKRFASEIPPAEKIEAYLATLHVQDLILAAACVEGHAEAWEHFVKTYRSYLHSVALAILGGQPNVTSALELADSLFADLYGLSGTKSGERSLFRYFHGRSSLKTWLRAVLAQRHIDAIRSSRRFTELESDVDGDLDVSRRAVASDRDSSPPDPHRERYVALFTRTLQVALGLLDPRDKERLRLYYAGQQTLAEIGRKLGEHESSVSRNLERVRRELRSEVEAALRNGRVAANGSEREPGLNDEQIALCFEYASEDAPIDLDTLLPGPGPRAERLEP